MLAGWVLWVCCMQDVFKFILVETKACSVSGETFSSWIPWNGMILSKIFSPVLQMQFLHYVPSAEIVFSRLLRSWSAWMADSLGTSGHGVMAKYSISGHYLFLWVNGTYPWYLPLIPGGFWTMYKQPWLSFKFCLIKRVEKREISSSWMRITGCTSRYWMKQC